MRRLLLLTLAVLACSPPELPVRGTWAMTALSTDSATTAPLGPSLTIVGVCTTATCDPDQPLERLRAQYRSASGRISTLGSDAEWTCRDTSIVALSPAPGTKRNRDVLVERRMRGETTCLVTQGSYTDSTLVKVVPSLRLDATVIDFVPIEEPDDSLPADTIPDVAPWLTEEFNYATTAAWRANSGHPMTSWYGPDRTSMVSDAALTGTRSIVPDPNDPSKKNLLYTYADRTGSGHICENGAVRTDLYLPERLVEAWVEIDFQFSANFSTMVADSAQYCMGKWNPAIGNYDKIDPKLGAYNSTPELKIAYLIPGWGGAGSYGFKAGQSGNSWTVSYPGSDSRLHWTTSPPMPFDGKWHRVRWHVRETKDGVVELTVDGQHVVGLDGERGGDDPIGKSRWEHLDLSGSQPLGMIILGATNNQGASQVQTLRWRTVRVWKVSPNWQGWAK